MISVVTVSELLYGAVRSTAAHRAVRSAFVEHVLGVFEALPITQTVARLHAELWSDLVGRGEMIGLHDSWIAATALARGAGVATTDVRDFSRVPGLRVVGV